MDLPSLKTLKLLAVACFALSASGCQVERDASTLQSQQTEADLDSTLSRSSNKFPDPPFLEESVEAYRAKLRVIANNLANVDSYGYKRERAILAPANYERHKKSPKIDESGSPIIAGVELGKGVRIVNVQSSFLQGAIEQTNRELDVAIEGRGFLIVEHPQTGEHCFTRFGNLSLTADGMLAISLNGINLCIPGITIPCDVHHIAIAPDGAVSYRHSGANSMIDAGVIQLAMFAAPDALSRHGGCLFLETDASGPAVIGSAGGEGRGVLRQRFLERSNVNPEQELQEYKETKAQIARLESLRELKR